LLLLLHAVGGIWVEPVVNGLVDEGGPIEAVVDVGVVRVHHVWILMVLIVVEGG
jgi:hypothetical protein